MRWLDGITKSMAFFYNHGALLDHRLDGSEFEPGGAWNATPRSLPSLETLDESESEKVGLKLNIQKTKIMASGPIASGFFTTSATRQAHSCSISQLIPLRPSSRSALSFLWSLLPRNKLTKTEKLPLLMGLNFSEKF